ncbi:MAG TPA: adenylate/guanylate cyclase domain-containing protein [Myxococcales bacterium]|nr:adenylate/guanylate cyclase domain-containing protein [Myxococcales bacterium]
MSVCAVCYRENEPVAGRCPSCGAPREAPRAPATARVPAPAAAGSGPRLTLRGGNGEVVEYPLGQSNVLGRSTTASVRLADREVSRKHSQIDKEGEEYVLRDLGSSNGTFLNGKRIYGPARLNDGDEVMIGTSRMEFRLWSGPVRARNAEIVHTGQTGELEGVVARTSAKANFVPVEQIKDVNQLRRDYERLRVGHEFSTFVRLERNLNELLERILEVAFDLIPCDNGVILLRDPHSQELVIQAMRQRKPGEGKVLVSDTLLAQVQLTKEGVLTSDAIADKRFQASHSIIALGVRSAMAVPLLSSSGDEVKGIMFLDSRERIAAFTTKDLEVLSAIAAQASVALENSEYARALEHEATQRAQLARFLSPALVEQAARGNIELSKGGALTELTMLFSDIRGFTSIAEKLPAQEVVSMLNDYFELMVDILFEHNGILDKFIGDAIMGLWGAPVSRPDDATNAVRAAVRMQKRVAEWNEERVAQGKVPLRIGIGLHTGHVVVGNMGSSKALSYTAIGDGVNLASRLCGVAREDMVVISEECARRAGKEKFVLEPLPPAKVKNREAPVEIYRVLEALE